MRRRAQALCPLYERLAGDTKKKDKAGSRTFRLMQLGCKSKGQSLARRGLCRVLFFEWCSHSVHSSPLTRWPTRQPPTSCATTHPGRSRWHGHDPARPWSCCGGAHLARALSAACGATRTPTGTARALAHGRRSFIQPGPSGCRLLRRCATLRCAVESRRYLPVTRGTLYPPSARLVDAHRDPTRVHESLPTRPRPNRTGSERHPAAAAAHDDCVSRCRAL